MADFVLISKHEFANLDQVATISIESNRMRISFVGGGAVHAEPEYATQISRKLLAKLGIQTEM